MKPIRIADALGIFAVDGEELPTCSWCGKQIATGLGVDDCLCGMCRDCKFIHDGGPCRSGVVLFLARWIVDGCVHAIQWNHHDVIVIPACFDYHPHSKDWPQGLGFALTESPVDCIRCLGA